MSGVLLGYAVGSGVAVEIPLKHTAICGQTLEAGKTTALEALITRAGIRALTFVTKRGEGAFTSARRVEPYFREQADWQFVASILEASRGEKMRFERAWIIRASRGARTLADVHRHVKAALADKSTRGLSADVYLTLDAYLEEVVPTISRVRWATSVQLAAGVNVMDLSGVPVPMQHLVIKSAIDWVHEKESDTVLVIPEAWKFIPQGRKTPVRQAAVAYIREGAGLKNFLWLDSQDLGGVDKELLRSVPVWILGVQREANEIKRTLSNIPASVAKPSAAAIATLGLGQFFACWGTHAIKTYAQPVWMPADLARQVATGTLDARNAAAIATAGNVRRAFDAAFGDGEDVIVRAGKREDNPVNEREAQQLRDENARLRGDVTRLEGQNADLVARLERLEGGDAGHRASGARHRGERSGARESAAARSTAPRGAAPGGDAAAAGADGHVDEATYQVIRERLIQEAPGILQLLVAQPELEVTIEREIVTADGSSTKGRVARLIAAKFLEESKRFSEILRELERTGTRVNNKSLSVALQELVVAGFLTKESVDRYKAVSEMRVRVVER